MTARPAPNVLWPALIIGALALHVVASLVTVWIATSNPSYAVEEDYYRKALAWDATRAQERRNAELGWQLDAEVTSAAETGGDPVLAARLTTADGRPLDGAAITLEGFHNARADDIVRAHLAGTGAGAYSSPVPMRRTGLWELRFAVERAGERFTHTEKVYLNLGSGRVVER